MTVKDLVLDDLAAWQKALRVASEILNSLSNDQIKAIACRGLLDLDHEWIKGICAEKLVDPAMVIEAIETSTYEALK